MIEIYISYLELINMFIGKHLMTVWYTVTIFHYVRHDFRGSNDTPHEERESTVGAMRMATTTIATIMITFITCPR